MSVFFRISGCIDDACYIRVYNVDDYSYAFVNEHYVTYQHLSTHSDPIDVAPYMQNGLNSFTFLTYNFDNIYSWGFQIIKNGDIIFNDIAGLAGAVANNSNTSMVYQFVYNKTIFVNLTKCSNITTTLSTGEFSD